MNINWKVRFQNKTFLTGLISLVVTQSHKGETLKQALFGK